MKRFLHAFSGKMNEMFGLLHDKTRSAVALIQSSTRGVIVVFLALALLVVLISLRFISNESFTAGVAATLSTVASKTHQAFFARSEPHRAAPEANRFACPPGNQAATAHVCQRRTPPSPPPSLPPSPSSPLPSHSCPDYFRWIHEDLRPWNRTGITRDMVAAAQKSADFRLVVLDGRAYMERYHKAFETRDVFTLWGILQLLNRYPGRIPDLELMFNCGDMPVIPYADHRDSAPPPPLFRYCKDDSTADILFPDWSFWGWPEVNVKPWKTLSEELREANERMSWMEREPYAYWKGNTGVCATRREVMQCNVSNGKEWNARIYQQDWGITRRQGFKGSDLASQCKHRYKIYIEGRAWSVSEKYILACDSPTLYVKTQFHDFFSRGLLPGRHYWPLPDRDKCRSIKFAVDWGNSHKKEAQAIGKEGSRFIEEQLKMDHVYDYMFHLLSEYAKLLTYKPSRPKNAIELCLESMACSAEGLIKTFMIESMPDLTSGSNPCTMPPPFNPQEIKELLRTKANCMKEVEMGVQKGHLNLVNNSRLC
ncbi:protein O-glucosyltransferase 1 [Phoenix dactylifera]|uniref:Protein O-glucosyltransferase 1 n=1 Tax=Phoenix dactylifera TaxID=42345 RepID=A0A8B7CV88_PHODC|nr:protein O-glucosyltransferase 1 [Phoenix dactylifera]